MNCAKGQLWRRRRELRRTIFLRAARSRALRNDVGEAEEFLTAGAALPGSERELAARARIMEARGDIEGAIRALRAKRTPTAAPLSSASLPSTKATPLPSTGSEISHSLRPISRQMASWRCVKFTCAGKNSPGRSSDSASQRHDRSGEGAVPRPVRARLRCGQFRPRASREIPRQMRRLGRPQ